MMLLTFISAFLMNSSPVFSAEGQGLSVLLGHTYYGKIPHSRCQVSITKSGKDVIFSYQEGNFFPTEKTYTAKNAVSVFERTAPPTDFGSGLELEFKDADTNFTIYVKPSYYVANNVRTDTIDAFQVLDQNEEIEAFCQYMH